VIYGWWGAEISSMGLWLAAAGGLMLSLFNLWEDTQKPKSHRVDKDGWYWFFFVVWPAAGALLALVYMRTGYNIDGILAFTLGVTAPTTIQTIIQRGKQHLGPPPGAEPP
jgi:hypothetical protein